MEAFQWGWVPPTAILILLFLGNGGYGTLIWVVVAELLPPKVRALGNAFNICICFILGFIASKTFVDLVLAIGRNITGSSDLDNCVFCFPRRQWNLLDVWSHLFPRRCLHIDIRPRDQGENNRGDPENV